MLLHVIPRKEVVAQSSAPKKVSQLQFGTLADVDIERAGEFEVTSKDLFAPNGCMDPRLGISDKQTTCRTCRWVDTVNTNVPSLL